jgi:hypothetical protein
MGEREMHASCHKTAVHARTLQVGASIPHDTPPLIVAWLYLVHPRQFTFDLGQLLKNCEKCQHRDTEENGEKSGACRLRPEQD